MKVRTNTVARASPRLLGDLIGEFAKEFRHISAIVASSSLSALLGVIANFALAHHISSIFSALFFGVAAIPVAALVVRQSFYLFAQVTDPHERSMDERAKPARKARRKPQAPQTVDPLTSLVRAIRSRHPDDLPISRRPENAENTRDEVSSSAEESAAKPEEQVLALENKEAIAIVDSIRELIRKDKPEPVRRNSQDHTEALPGESVPPKS